MAAVRRWLRLPASPIEHSVEGRAFVFSGFAVAVLAIALYGQDYVVPVIGVIAAGIGHVVSFRERNHKRGFWRQVFLAALVFGALFYLIADSALALFGGILPQANFAILLVAITSFDLKTRRNCYSSLWISLAILYLAAVYAWDYAFGILLAQASWEESVGLSRCLSRRRSRSPRSSSLCRTSRASKATSRARPSHWSSSQAIRRARRPASTCTFGEGSAMRP